MLRVQISTLKEKVGVGAAGKEDGEQNEERGPGIGLGPVRKSFAQRVVNQPESTAKQQHEAVSKLQGLWRGKMVRKLAQSTAQRVGAVTGMHTWQRHGDLDAKERNMHSLHQGEGR
jgi:hypothetical protein